jgi:DNA-binding response OmpR family regulator
MAQDRALQAASAVVLVVDTNAPRRTGKAAELRQEGFEVFEVAHAAAARAILDAVAIDVVFSDTDLIGGAALSQWVELCRPATQFAWILDTESDELAAVH